MTRPEYSWLVAYGLVVIPEIIILASNRLDESLQECLIEFPEGWTFGCDHIQELNGIGFGPSYLSGHLNLNCIHVGAHDADGRNVVCIGARPVYAFDHDGF